LEHGDQSIMGYCLMIFGACEVIGSFASGLISDRIGRLPVLLSAAPIVASGLTCSVLATKQTYFLFFIAYALFGLGDSCVNVIVYSSLGTLLRNDLQSAFAFLRLLIAAGTALGFVLSLYLSVMLVAVVVGSAFAVGLTGATLMHCAVVRLDGPETLREIPERNGAMQ
jgi:MFS family permease